MFDPQKFGRYIAAKRKELDLTQSALADRLDVTRQAVSRYELGDSFPDVSVLVIIAEVFSVTLDELILAGGATMGEKQILKNAAQGICAESGEFEDVMNLAPLLRPSTLSALAEKYAKEGIDITSVVTLSEYLSDNSIAELIGKASFDTFDEEVLARFLPILDNASKAAVFEKILEGKLSYLFIEKFIPHASHLICQMEAAVIDGALPAEVLRYINDYVSAGA
ncbi:MAG: helix-turn-helix transcriptional regulator [Clostridia bacterium]|nr:helix-turn-helix transcriptional regulator [Clostridia bacterium]